MSSAEAPSEPSAKPPKTRVKLEDRLNREQKRVLKKLREESARRNYVPDEVKELSEYLFFRGLLKSSIIDNPDEAGKTKTSLWDYAVNSQLEETSVETGVARDTRIDPEDIINSKPGYMMRQDKPKMQLKELEEKNLGLTCMGQGFRAHFSILHDIPILQDIFAPKVDFAYGVFCKAHNVQPLMSRFCGRVPEELLLTDSYYQDVMLHSPQLETTIMLVTTRDLPLASLQRDCLSKLAERVKKGISFSPVDEEGNKLKAPKPTSFDVRQALDLKTVFTPQVLRDQPFMTWDGKKVKKFTKFFISTNPQGGFCVEAESPGTLAEQESVYLADYTSRHLTYALLDCFIGKHAIDPVAKVDIGACFLYFANGFKLDDGAGDPNRVQNPEEVWDQIDAETRVGWFGKKPDDKRKSSPSGVNGTVMAPPALTDAGQLVSASSVPAAQIAAKSDAVTPPAAASLSLSQFSLKKKSIDQLPPAMHAGFNPQQALQSALKWLPWHNQR